MIRIRVPATSANLGPGFDTLGMALQFYNHFEVAPAETLSVELSKHTCIETDGLSLDPSENLLAKAYSAYFQFRQETPIPARLVIEGHIPLSRGLGSSSSAIVAGLVLANHMHPDPLPKTQLVPWAIQLEGHPDNVVPALLGGVQCCVSEDHRISLVWPSEWGIILIIPPTKLHTNEARTILPDHYSRQEAVANLRGMAAWIYAVEHKDASLFQEALQSDTIHEPARGALIPEWPVLKEALSQTTAMGSVISGSGSTLAVFTPSSVSHHQCFERLKTVTELSHCKIVSVKADTDGVYTLPTTTSNTTLPEALF